MAYSFDPARPFCLIRRKDESQILWLTGAIQEARALAEVPRQSGVPGRDCVDSVSMVPFCQARERGFPVRDAGEPIITLVVEQQGHLELEQVVRDFPKTPIQLDEQRYDIAGPDYEQLIARILRDEIGRGKGSNFVIPRACHFRFRDFGPDQILSLFRSLLLHEYGSYWSFAFFDGRQYFVGASPERHISARKGEVRMNPISGTFRKAEAAQKGDPRRALLAFLNDEKEIYELFMVVDEELKIMAELCEGGGTVVGPMLKEMSRLIHTEYLLLGKSQRDVVDLFRGSMYAPTVTGSPLQSAFRVIEAYEPSSRGYYGAALMLLGRDADGADVLDAPITIRTFTIDRHGEGTALAGATLVRHSKPADEVKETETKISGLLHAVQQTNLGSPAPPKPLLGSFDEELQTLLHQRNLYLSRFWFEPQLSEFNVATGLLDKRIVIIDNEDSFSVMLRRMLEQMGAKVTLVSFAHYDPTLAVDLTVVGPGPGDPNDLGDPKMAKLRAIVSQLVDSERPFLAECLGHQVLCLALGLRVARKDLPFQGTQELIDYFGRMERVGFYNTFCGIAEGELPGVSVAFDPASREIHALSSRTFLGVQFHLESILTPGGYGILRDAAVGLIHRRGSVRPPEY
jgi:phenazine biosynthesis protein phzE